MKGESKCIQKYSSYCVGDLDSNKPGAETGWEEGKENNNDKKKERVIISQHEVITSIYLWRVNLCHSLRFLTMVTATPTVTSTPHPAPSPAWPGW